MQSQAVVEQVCWRRGSKDGVEKDSVHRSLEVVSSTAEIRDTIPEPT